MARRRGSVLAFGLFLGLAAIQAGGDILFDASQKPGPEPVTALYVFPMSVEDTPAVFALKWQGELRAGDGRIRLVDLRRNPIHDEQLDSAGTSRYALAGPLYTSGDYRFEVELEKAVGEWALVAMRLPEGKELDALLASGPLMILVGFGFFIGWRLYSRVGMAWFLAGAALWLAAVLPKELWRLGLNECILGYVEGHASATAYILFGCVYQGLLAAVFEVGVLYAASRFWQGLSDRPDRAVAVGVGAGALKAGVLGLLVLVTTVEAFRGENTETVVEVSYTIFTTPLYWLLGPVRQILSVLCQLGARVALLYGMARGKRAFVAAGFVILAGHAAVGSLPYLSEELERLSLWWTELAVFPLALAAFYLARWCFHRWPSRRGRTFLQGRVSPSGSA